VRTVTVVRYRSKPDRADENQALVAQVFAQLHAEQPDGLRYVTLRLADGVSFVHVSTARTADGSNPLPGLAAFREFAADLAARVEAPPVSSPGDVVATYTPAG